jgi:hypothetical protein
MSRMRVPLVIRTPTSASTRAYRQTLATPLTRKMTQFSRMLIWVILGFAALRFLSEYSADTTG